MDVSLLGFAGLHEISNIHPVLVHFPIVLFPISLILYLLAWVFNNEWICLSARLILILGLISAIGAVISGTLASNTIQHSEAVHHIMQTHERLAYMVLILSGFLTVWSFVKRGIYPRLFGLFIALLLGLCVLIFQNADLGARMVFIHGAGVKITTPAAEHEHDHEHHHHHEEP